MAEVSEARVATADLPVVEKAGPVGQANTRFLNVLFGAQRILVEEAIFATEEWFDRARTETHLFAELLSKIAGAHSVSNIQTMCRECGQHQIDFIRRDCGRLVKHGQRMVEAASKLVGTA
ncbi:hypothetical protein [Bradyrhizobium sp. ARR65]|uniref:hypothetical protein n=1 Tax=Bradyrhizobium sp. ARR65 TaxID=1040989 RepID=UPI00046576D6|nr:hypothetical protein [Bradyrhizobium sp. ARR65]